MNGNHRNSESIEEEKQSNGIGLCEALDLLFSKDCVKNTAKLDKLSQSTNILLVQTNNVFECDKIKNMDFEIVIEATTLTLDSFRSDVVLDGDDKKYFYLFNWIDDTERGLIEVFYPYTGNIYKLTADKSGKEWVNINSFCANY